MQTRISHLIIATALVLLAGPAAEAEHPSGAFYIGIHGGGHLSLGSWDLNEDGQALFGPETGAAGGLRLGGILGRWVGLELGATVLPTTSEQSGESNLAASYTADLHIFFTDSDWVPFLDLGGGAYHLLDGDLGPDFDYHLHYGLGLRGMLADWIALRLDARHLMTDGYEGTHIASNLEVTIGFDFFAWRSDGAPDDRDGDGIPDAQDACPAKPGPAGTRGCPDADGDGIVDSNDRCPKAPGPVAFGGCPDTDQDGIPDPDDRCPNTPGSPQMHGCPDADGDGITDSLDRCPRTPGPAEYRGCPDTDGDGIADVDDRCPERPGVPEEQGCLPKIIAEKFSGALEGIYFKTGSARIRSKSFGILNEAAVVLNQYQTLRVRIEGHTDNRGRDEKNMSLSGARARSVRTYLVEQGVAASRLDAIGFGETRPVDTNKNRKGRGKNRRIEFIILGR